jgi:ABC-type multidrug transport system fused ATPase/permease subunit
MRSFHLSYVAPAATEKSIIDTVVKLRDDNGLTVVSVSHRPATAVKANKVIVLRGRGTVAEEGGYEELVSREGGLFKRFVDISKED